ncbi:MAG: NUDIX hydrolase [Acidimicrobiia bacterium]|nr:NUDIX hydrolase [Acidimicrobiia bacterium]MDX2467831.1 NUDIX hydrolase [Acidimicrobiia bacterium]
MTYPVWVEGEWVDVPVPSMAGEALVVPNVAAIVLSQDRAQMLLQRRDKVGEPVRGRLEIPGGRWGAGEAPEDAVAREVREEAGIELVEPVAGVSRLELGEHKSCGAVHPVAVVNGLDGTYPSLHVVFECIGAGEPRPQPGETADPRWWPLDEVRAMLRNDPDGFVDQTRAMLVVYFGD